MMKTFPGFKTRGFVLAAAFFAGSGPGADAFAQQTPFLIDLNSKTATQIGTSGDEALASGINDAGQVVGEFKAAGGSEHAFITGPTGQE